MATDNETVAKIVNEMRDRNAVRKVRLRQYGGVHLNCSIAPDDLPKEYANRVEKAHNHEVDELNFKLLTAKSEQKTAANVIIEQTNKIEELQREVEELQRRLKVAEDALDSAWMYADKLPHQWPLPKMVRDRMKNALAAIREEGDAK